MPGGKRPGPSVKDPKTYERVRERGASKQQAARIANASAKTSRKSVAKKGGRSPAYEDWNKEDLVRRARELDISGRSSMSKGQLIKAIRNS
jgi:hypothetical protein